MPAPSDTAAVILAGGRGRRMGGALKALLPLGGAPLLTHLLRRLRPQTFSIAISANDAAVAQAAEGLPLLADAHGDRRGPLAGILAGLAWASREQPGVRWLASLPVDCPFTPPDLLGRLRAVAEQDGVARVVVATSAGHAHPTAALWDLSLHDALAQVVEEGTTLSVRRFYESLPHQLCDFSVGAIDPFFNINTPDDLAWAENALAMGEDLEPVVAGDADQCHADGLRLADGEQGGR
jgi:molybdopterin-guanine dinucleotide biosynthesis protein A